MCIHVLTAPSFGGGVTLSPKGGHCRGEGHDVHRRGAEAKVSRSRNAQQGAAAPGRGGVVGPPRDERSQMQINSDLGSQIPAPLAALKIAQRSACWLQSPSSIRAPGSGPAAPQRIPPLPPRTPPRPKHLCGEATCTALSSTPADPFSCRRGDLLLHSPTGSPAAAGGVCRCSRFLQSHIHHRERLGDLGQRSSWFAKTQP